MNIETDKITNTTPDEISIRDASGAEIVSIPPDTNHQLRLTEAPAQSFTTDIGRFAIWTHHPPVYGAIEGTIPEDGRIMVSLPVGQRFAELNDPRYANRIFGPDTGPSKLGGAPTGAYRENGQVCGCHTLIKYY